MDSKEICNTLNSVRQDKNVIFENMAKDTGMGLSYVCGIMNGRHNIGLNNLVKMCDYLDLEILLFKKPVNEEVKRMAVTPSRPEGGINFQTPVPDKEEE